MEKTAILFHAPQMAGLARRICEKDARIQLGEISWRRFEDGFPDIYIQKQRDIRRKNVALLMSFDTQGDIFEQLSVAYALPRCGAQRFQIILPYFSTGTMERVDAEGQVATAKTLARMLSSMPLCGQGPAEVVLYDVHALQQRFYFGDNVVPRLKTGTKYLKRELAGMQDVTIWFPDFGARKRFGNFFKEFPQGVSEKIRDGDERNITLVEGNPRGRNVVIVDDIIKSGGTLLRNAEVLMRAGARTVSMYATHASCPQESWKLFLDAGLANVWITDSCPHTAEKVDGKDPFRLISLAESIAHVIVDEDELLPA